MRPSGLIQLMNILAGLLGPIIFAGALRPPRTGIYLLLAFLSMACSGVYLVWAHRHSKDLRNPFLLAFFFGCGIAARLAGIEHSTNDVVWFHNYYTRIQKMDYLEMLTGRFGNSNLFYAHLLFVMTRFPLDSFWAIKGIGLFFEGLLVFFAFQITFYISKDKTKAWLAAILTYLAPTVILNSAFWGQWDAVYTSFLLGFFWFHLKSEGRPFSKNGWASIFFLSLAFAAKLQSIFVFGFLIFLLFSGGISLLQLPLAGAGYGILTGASFLAGGSSQGASWAYLRQMNAFNEHLLASAPNLYALFFNIKTAISFTPGLALSFFLAVIGFFVLFTICLDSKKIDPFLRLKLFLISLITIPFVLPHMCDRYFYPADVTSILLAVLLPGFWWIPLLVVGASLHAAHTFLNIQTSLPDWLSPFAMGTAMSALWRNVWQETGTKLESLNSGSDKPVARASGAGRTILICLTLSALFAFYVYQNHQPKLLVPGIEVVKSHQDWGKLQFHKNVKGSPLVVNQKHFPKGLGTHSSSHIELRLRKNWRVFKGACGVDRSAWNQIVASCTLQTKEGKILWESGSVKKNEIKFFKIENDHFGEDITLKARANQTSGAHLDWVDLSLE